MEWEKSKRLYEEACKWIPGGVNSPVRSARAVGMNPIFVKEARGCRLVDEDGNTYIDYVGSWGPLIVGHSHPDIVEAVRRAAEKGTSYGIPTQLEISMAQKVVEMVPSIDMVRMVSSGTEATMSAIRLARGYTGRKKIIKFNGCYHGHGDCLLVQSGSGLATLGIPGSPGIPEEIVMHTLSLPYNDLGQVEEVMERMGKEVAAIIVEPVAANMGVVLPRPGFLQGLRKLCDAFGTVLIFDEVISGFRLAAGGAQEVFGVLPDLTCLGKIIGGGLPVGAYGGKREIMMKMAPVGDIYQAGTLSGNPLAMSAGLATLNILSSAGIYEVLEEKANYLVHGLAEGAKAAGVSVRMNRIGSLGCGFFTAEEVCDFESALKADTQAYAVFFQEMLKGGIYMAPSQFEAFFVSLAHEKSDLDRTVEVAAQAFERVREHSARG
ncbi:glutamate-1-semialdehyde 2,1-aminomutase [Desulforhabdus amnigena]|uniref:Glutamate-1-semialdehyde 2,1-aminomutase n=1 Tax=Desulforhabdus amnigena TaxID=40218 RepID=A0A9W6CZM5_9BACT|nr:glutamate-1-semialdehyde 2,1-aminomutase [Desulforhabdus amnigena]NLJ27356.1 glutamate-1-semialdehyde 2,1-aminomutase [Deltaproteobacteria bacterium]GLI34711.1 glutamate-1-semialdehyde 2,1-aminomutase [Desulforhabdus amnigena]